MMELEKLPGLGPVSAEKLKKVGLDSAEKLEAVGSMNAFLLVREQVDKGACLSFLYGLEGAIQRKRSKELSKTDKEALRQFVAALED